MTATGQFIIQQVTRCVAVSTVSTSAMDAAEKSVRSRQRSPSTTAATSVRPRMCSEREGALTSTEYRGFCKWLAACGHTCSGAFARYGRHWQVNDSPGLSGNKTSGSLCRFGSHESIWQACAPYITLHLWLAELHPLRGCRCVIRRGDLYRDP